MLEAYRRGLLEPNYPHGLHSMIRERMILQSIEKEQLGDYVKWVGVTQAVSYAPHIDPRRLGEFYESVSSIVKRGILTTQNYSKGDIKMLVDRVRQATPMDESLASLYNTFVEAGIPDLIKEYNENGQKKLKK